MFRVRIRPAISDERCSLLDLQRRASLTHDAYRDHLLQHPDAIDLPVEHIECGGTFVAEIDDRIAGFAVILARPDGFMELDGLFVEPERSRSGVGRRLVQEARHRAIESKAEGLMVVASPETQEFYCRCGFVPTEEVTTRFGTAIAMTMPTLVRTSRT